MIYSYRYIIIYSKKGTLLTSFFIIVDSVVIRPSRRNLVTLNKALPNQLLILLLLSMMMRNRLGLTKTFVIITLCALISASVRSENLSPSNIK